MSDKKLKTNIKSIVTPLDKIKLLNGKKYNRIIDSTSLPKDREVRAEKMKWKKDNYGFIAQDVEKVMPELVGYDHISDTKGINYVGVIPILVEAMKEQQQMIEDLKDEITTMKNDCCSDTKNSKLKSASLSTEISSKLYQNAPNPFSESTEIRFEIPENTQSAMICIYNMNGTQLKCYNLNQTGNGSITVNGSELEAGMYLYALIVDGKEVDTKRMILTN